MEEVSIDEVFGTDEESLKSLLSSGDNRCIISEEETSDYGYKDDRKEITLAAFVVCVSHSCNNLSLYKIPGQAGDYIVQTMPETTLRVFSGIADVLISNTC